MSPRVQAALAALAAAQAEYAAALVEATGSSRTTSTPRFLTVREFCEVTGLSRSAVARAMRRGELVPTRIGRKVLIPADALERP